MRITWKEYRNDPVKYADASKEEKVFIVLGDLPEIEIDEDVRRKVYSKAKMKELWKTHGVKGVDHDALLREWRKPRQPS